jgi:selenide, water dikinase
MALRATGDCGKGDTGNGAPGSAAAGAQRAPVALTAHSHGAGCACKIGAAELAPLLGSLPAAVDPDLLVGAGTSDDAAVYRLRDDLALVQSVDFFTAIVDDPYDFGRIAAANALSDVYAMGAEPVLALNLVAYSLERLGEAALAEILRGGSDMAASAGVAIGGGHSIDDPEPKYGMAVSGVVDPRRVLTNAGGEPGDELFLTKPLGVGLITTAAKRGIADPPTLARAIDRMTTLNAAAAKAALAADARAMTDVTGFGLLGHLHELCEASGCAAEIMPEAVPAIDGALALAADPRARAGGSKRNAAHAETFTEWASEPGEDRRFLLADATTSGGLLVAVAPERAADAPGVRIGRLTQGPPGSILAGARSAA